MGLKTKRIIAGAAAVFVVLALCSPAQTASHDTAAGNEVPVPGRVTMLDLGANKCIPCKMMAPILEELKKAYEGRAEIIFIDVWENRDVAKKYGIRAIPTQIFFNEKGKEVRRHTGFMDKKTIVKHLSALGVKPPEKYRDL